MSTFGIRLGLFALCLQIFLPSFVSASGVAPISVQAGTNAVGADQSFSSLPHDYIQSCIDAGYFSKPSLSKIVGSVFMLGGPAFAWWYASRKLSNDKKAREYDLQRRQQAQMGDPMQMLMRQMLQQGQANGADMSMMFPGMEGAAQEEVPQMEMDVAGDAIPNDDIAEVQASEAAAQTAARETDATRQPMVMEPFVDEAQEIADVEQAQEKKEEKEQVVQKSTELGPEYILSKNERIFWNVVLWCARVLTFVGGYECYMTFNHWYKGNNIPAIMRAQINQFNDYLAKRTVYKQELASLANVRLNTELRFGSFDRLNIALDNQMMKIKDDAQLDDLIRDPRRAALREAQMQCDLINTANRVRHHAMTHPGTTGLEALNHGEKKNLVNNLAEARLQEIDNGAFDTMHAGLTAMNARRDRGAAWLLNKIGLGNWGRAWAGSSRFTPQELGQAQTQNAS